MANISTVFSRLIDDGSLSEVFNNLHDKNRLILGLVASLRKLGKSDEALDLCEEVLSGTPDDSDFLFLSLDILSEKGEVDRVFNRIKFMKGIGVDSTIMTEEIKKQLNVAVQVHSTCLETGDLEKASKIADALVSFYPDITFFREAQQQDRWRLRQKHYDLFMDYERIHYDTVVELAEACRAVADRDGEIKHRLEAYRHPHDVTRHSALRLQNVVLLMSRILSVDKAEFTPEHIQLVKTLLSEIPSIPVSPMFAEDYADDPAARFDRFYRLLMGTIDLDAVLAPSTELLPPLPAYFMTATGEPMDLDGLIARSKELEAKVVYSTSTSAEYFERYARSYITSMLKTSDCQCMVIVYVCAAKERLPELVASLGMDDPRLIFASDDFDPQAHEIKLYAPTEGEPYHVHGIYFAVSSLFRSDYATKYLGLPVFVTGIDTILQRGVVDLLEQFKGYDVVLNKAGAKFTLGSQLVNNIVLVQPGANGLLFVDFLKRYLGRHLEATVQPAFMDQMDLHMAKIHIEKNAADLKLGFFGEDDINNVMFNKDNIQGHMEKVTKYRFLNMFIGGNPGNAMSSEDIATKEEDLAEA